MMTYTVVPCDHYMDTHMKTEEHVGMFVYVHIYMYVYMW